MKIITIEQVMAAYGFSRKYATKLLNTRGCPVLPRKKGQHYHIVAEAFEDWLRSQIK